MKRLKLLFCLLISLCFMTSPIEAKDKKYKNGDSYSGEWKKGKPEGKGKMVFSNGSIYEGLWHEGKIAGEGIFEGAGTKFEGTFTPIYENEDLVSFKPIKGVFTFPDAQMEGEWDENNIFHGTLTGKTFSFKGLLDVDENVYKEGRIDGTDGSYMEGTMLLTPQFEGKLHKYVLQNSSALDVPAIYSGEFTNGKFIGHISGPKLTNTITEFEIDIDENGNQYGSLALKNGGEYKGYIKNNKFYGEGVLEMKDGSFSGTWSNGILTDGIIKQWDNNKKEYVFSVERKKTTYSFPDGQIIAINGITDGYSNLYSEVIKYKEKQAEIKRQNEIKKQQEKEEREKEKFIKFFDTNYAGLIYMAQDASFSDSAEDSIALFLFQAKSDVILKLLRGGKVALKTYRKTSSNELYENMVMSIMNGAEDDIFELKYDSSTGDLIIPEINARIRISKDKNTATYIYPSGKGFKMKRVRK